MHGTRLADKVNSRNTLSENADFDKRKKMEWSCSRQSNKYHNVNMSTRGEGTTRIMYVTYILITDHYTNPFFQVKKKQTMSASSQNQNSYTNERTKQTN